MAGCSPAYLNVSGSGARHSRPRTQRPSVSETRNRAGQ
jgi:hypothetical protein